MFHFAKHRMFIRKLVVAKRFKAVHRLKLLHVEYDELATNGHLNSRDGNCREISKRCLKLCCSTVGVICNDVIRF